MKIPQKFIPKKYPESKLKQLLEKQNIEQDKKVYPKKLYGEIKKELPNFVDYIIGLYPQLEIIKTTYKGKVVWGFYENLTKQTSKGRPMKISQIIGSAYEYVEDVSKDTSEYGYQGRIFIGGEWHDLKYRQGYHCFDNVNFIISTKDSLRYDQKKDIPFP